MSELLTEFHESLPALPVSLDEYDDAFHYRDALRDRGYIPSHPVRFLGQCAAQGSKERVQYLHGLLMPNPQNLVTNSQSNAVSDDMKETVQDLIDHYVYLSAKHRRLEALNDDDASFLREALEVWSETREDYVDVQRCIENHWEEQRDG